MKFVICFLLISLFTGCVTAPRAGSHSAPREARSVGVQEDENEVPAPLFARGDIVKHVLSGEVGQVRYGYRFPFSGVWRYRVVSYHRYHPTRREEWYDEHELEPHGSPIAR